MCGVAAIFNKDRQEAVSRSTLSDMTRLLTHRGPDDSGLFVDREVGLGHRRLSVIDLDAGHQPMCGPSGTTWIAYNGEIYNYKALMAELRAEGVRLRTQCDTEVLLALYERHGESFVERLNGMFAFALWDQRHRRFIVARDRLGIKPLYVWEGPDSVVVASEIKAVLAHPRVPRALREGALPEFLQFRQLSGDRTLFAEIEALPPGTIRIHQERGSTSRAYWRIPSPGTADAGTARRAEEELQALLLDSIDLRLVADVPLGTFNSGGLDSSLVTTMTVRQVSHPLKTFSIGFDEPEFDEREHARRLSRSAGTVHHEIIARPDVFAAELPRTLWHHDEPINHANSVLIRLLSLLAKRHVTVVLTGEGADELFAGYPRYRIIRAIQAIRAFAGGAERPLRVASGLLPGRKARLIHTSLGRPADYLVASNARYMLESDVAQVVDGDSLGRRRCLAATFAEPLRELLAFELRTYLHNVLERLDKMTMSAGLEGRVPFLDHRIVELAAAIPLRAKMPWLRTKQAVKNVARDYLPREVADRPKSGFGVPLASWMRREDSLGPYLDLLGEARTRDRGWWRPGAVEACVRDHRAGADRSELLWSLINCELWARLMLDGDASFAVARGSVSLE